MKFEWILYVYDINKLLGKGRRVKEKVVENKLKKYLKVNLVEVLDNRWISVKKYIS